MRLTTVFFPLLACLGIDVLGARALYGLDRRQTTADNSTLNQERADAVKSAFQYAWDGYYLYAFPHDELHPITNNYSDSRYFLFINY